MNPMVLRLGVGSALLLSSCTTTVVYSSAWSTRSAYGLENHSGTLVVPLSINGDAAGLCLDVEVDCDSGRVSTELMAPDDRVLWRQTVNGGRLDQALTLPPVTGEWRCRFVFDDFSGDYSVDLSARSEPAIGWCVEVVSIEVESASDSGDA